MMRVANFLRAIRSLPVGTIEDLTGGEPFIVLSPHPDDESLGTGGLIAEACAKSQHVEVVLMTDGTGSHPNSAAYPPRRLAALRRRELQEAGKHLGLPGGRLTCLQMPDTRLPTSGAEFEAAVDTIAGLVDDTGARSVFVTWKHDPHCDHEASAAIAWAVRDRNPALKLWSYPIWGWHLDRKAILNDPPPVGMRIDIAPWLAAKKAAMEAHRSQMTDLIADDPQGFRFTRKKLAPFTGPFEYFFEVPR